MRMLSASLVAIAVLIAPAAGSAAPAPHALPADPARLAQPVGWWEEQRRPDEPRQRYDRLPPNMRDYYNMLEDRIQTLEGWRGGDLRARNPGQYRAISDLIEQMRREEYAILQFRYRR